jgi:hypothetical protein
MRPGYGYGNSHTYPYYPAYIPYYSVIDPTTYGGPVDGAAPAEDDDQYLGGPTVFDRRGPGYAYRPGDSVPRPQQDQASYAPDPNLADSPPEPPQPDTILVFKDGHKQQVSNYAIVGANLFDLSNGRRQKIAISDLDVAATQKANDAQGVDFKLPVLPSGS